MLSQLHIWSDSLILTYVCEHACLCLCVRRSVVVDMLSCRASAKQNKKQKRDFFCIFNGVFRGNIQNSFLDWVGYYILFWFQIGQQDLQGDFWRGQLWGMWTIIITVWNLDWLWPIEGSLLHREAGRVPSRLLLSKWIFIHSSVNKREGYVLLEAHE